MDNGQWTMDKQLVQEIDVKIVSKMIDVQWILTDINNGYRQWMDGQT